MSRFRMYPTPEQEQAMLRHCADARLTWNLCLQQQKMYQKMPYGPNAPKKNKSLAKALGKHDVGPMTKKQRLALVEYMKTYVPEEKKPYVGCETEGKHNHGPKEYSGPHTFAGTGACRTGKNTPPSWVEQGRQLTEARKEIDWLAEGGYDVQNNGIRDFAQAMKNFFGGSHRFPTFRTRDDNGFLCAKTNSTKGLKVYNKSNGAIRVDKIGWVKVRFFSQGKDAIPDFKSVRITLDNTGKWHAAVVSVPDTIDGPQDNSIVGIDLGIVHTVALSDGTFFDMPDRLRKEKRRAQKNLSRTEKGSNRRQRAKLRLAKKAQREANIKKAFIEQVTTHIARTYDTIVIEDLKVKNMTRSAKGTIEEPGTNVKQKSGLNRSILEQNWAMFRARLEYKAKGRVIAVNPAYTSQTCYDCKYVDKENRTDQATFTCLQCGYSANADTNAARNIAEVASVTARGAFSSLDAATKRESETVGSETVSLAETVVEDLSAKKLSRKRASVT